jgi:2'-5' RNA ligase
VSDGRVRLFVALELPASVREALTGWVTALPGSVKQSVRFVAPEALHVTLCFLGSQPEHEIEPIAAACGIVMAEPVVDLRLLGSVWLPRRRPRVLAIALEDPGAALGRIQALLSDALAAGGWYRAEKRPYLAHVTVARVTGAIVRARLPPPPNLGFRGSRVVLYRSRLQRGGARYEALAAVALRGLRARPGGASTA